MSRGVCIAIVLEVLGVLCMYISGGGIKVWGGSRGWGGGLTAENRAFGDAPAINCTSFLYHGRNCSLGQI